MVTLMFDLKVQRVQSQRQLLFKTNEISVPNAQNCGIEENGIDCIYTTLRLSA